MFPQCYLNYMNACQRVMPVMPGSFPSSFPGMMPMPGPGVVPVPMQSPVGFTGMYEGGEDMMSDGMMQGTGMGGNMVPGPGVAGISQGMAPGGTGTGQGVMPGGAGTGVLPSQVPLMTSPFETAPGSPTDLDVEYTQGFLRTQIGKRVRVTFLLGTSTLQDREGILDRVGISYVIIRETQTNNITLCDIYSIKFVYIVQ